MMHKVSPETDEAFLVEWPLRPVMHLPEMEMNDAPPRHGCSSQPAPPGHCGELPLGWTVAHLTLLPGQSASWRVVADSEIQNHHSHVRLTRLFYAYECDMQQGDVLRDTRGERIGLRTDSSGKTNITVTNEHAGRRASSGGWRVAAGGWLSRLQEILVDLSVPRVR